MSTLIVPLNGSRMKLDLLFDRAYERPVPDVAQEAPGDDVYHPADQRAHHLRGVNIRPGLSRVGPPFRLAAARGNGEVGLRIGKGDVEMQEGGPSAGAGHVEGVAESVAPRRR